MKSCPCVGSSGKAARSTELGTITFRPSGAVNITPGEDGAVLTRGDEEGLGESCNTSGLRGGDLGSGEFPAVVAPEDWLVVSIFVSFFCVLNQDQDVAE